MINVKKFEKMYKKYLLELLKLGIIPSFDQVIQRGAGQIPDVTSSNEPIFKYKPQGRKQIFDTILYNRSIENIRYDLELLFDEMDDITKENIKRVLHANLYHAVHSSELKRLSKTLDALLFSTSGADDNFFVQFEDFSSTAKLDTANSDLAVINTAEKKLVLPIGLQGSLKIDINHLKNLGSPLDLSISGTNVINLGNIPGSIFGNIVTDSVYPWGLILESDIDQAIEIGFTVRLKAEEFINRITLVHHGDKPQTCFVRTSVDKINIKDIVDYSDGILLQDQATIQSLDFEDRLVDYIHLTLKKDRADSYEDLEDGSKKFRYIFGLANISVYSTGRKEKAVYQSKPFDFSSDLAAISRVSLTADAFIPEDTSANFYVAGVSNDGTIGNFISITPDNFSVTSGPPKVRILQDTFIDTQEFTTTDSSPVLIETANNINFYNIKSIDTEPIFGTSKLYRGNKVWLRDNSTAVNPILVKDNFIPFSKGDTQSLYIVITESVSPIVVNSAGTDVYAAVLTKAPLYNPAKGHFVKPDISVNPEKDTQPNYAIYNVTLNLSDIQRTSVFTFEAGSVASTGGPRTYNTNIKVISYGGVGSVTLKKTDNTHTYVDGIDYVLVLDENGYPTGEITALHADLVATVGGSWTSVTLVYNVDVNLTRFVSTVTGQQLFFNLESGALPSGDIIIKYRHIADKILKASVKAKSTYGIIPGSIYIQGVDYIFDSINGTIQRLSTGNIDPGSDIYIDFKYNDTSEQLQQFFIWAHVDPSFTDLIKTKLQETGAFLTENTLTPDTERKEEFLVSIPKVGIVNLTNATEWPFMSGWVQFIVKSIDPDEEDNALINQVIGLQDRESGFIFVQGGHYFDELTAYRDPLVQVSYSTLKYNTLKNDHSRFAIREVLGGNIIYQVVVNFKPNTDTLLYRFIPNSEAGTASNDNIVEIPEEWYLQWSSLNATDESVSKIVVKIELNRKQSVDGNITPKIDNYFIKVGY